MKVFDCTCSWRFVVGRKHVYGPIYTMPDHGHPYSCYSQGRMMTRREFEDWYADCAYVYSH